MLCKKGTDSIRQEVEDCRRRLSVDAIDLYQIHWPPDPDSAELRSVSINLLFSPTG
jgi:aryl-alcohol dehydrogenase-like predicted oxidoreductase